MLRDTRSWLISSIILVLLASLLVAPLALAQDSGDASASGSGAGDDTADTSTAPCPLTQGFWKNHADAWPVDTLTIGGQAYTKEELLTILQTPVSGDASLILAYQLIAAKLNVANGAASEDVEAFIAEADELLAGMEGRLPYDVAPSSALGQSMVGVAVNLDHYNNRHLTPDCDVNVMPSVIIIQGPVTVIVDNVITIYDIDITIDPADPLLTVIQIGDVIHVVGDAVPDGDTVIIVAIFITFIDVDVYVNVDGQVWRDPGNCANAPPPWAPAHGWRARCGGDGPGSGSHSGSRSKSKS